MVLKSYYSCSKKKKINWAPASSLWINILPGCVRETNIFWGSNISQSHPPRGTLFWKTSQYSEQNISTGVLSKSPLSAPLFSCKFCKFPEQLFVEHALQNCCFWLLFICGCSSALSHFISLVSFIPLITSENQRFSDVFRGYRKRPVAWNGLIFMCLSAAHRLFKLIFATTRWCRNIVLATLF